MKYYLTQEELLKYALSNGMINLAEVSKQVKMEMINRIEEVHNYKITPLQGANDQRWQTYVVDKTKKNRTKGS